MAHSTRTRLKIITHIAAVTPFAVLIFDFLNNGLGADPIREITLRTGRDALILLVFALSIAPVKNIFGLNQLMSLRRTIGLYAFFYICLHFLTFIGLDYQFNWQLIKEGIFEKPYALFGFSTFLLLIPLAVTSTNGWIRRLGKNWKRLHRLIYVAVIFDSIHFLWQAKSKALWVEPLIYTSLFLILISLRLPPVKDRLTFISK